MDIDLLSKIVKELILDNDRVVLPGLGAFVAEMVPAAFSDKGYTINPPYRKLYFRSRPDEGDELIRFYADSNNLDSEMADRVIREFVGELKSVLISKRVVVFPGLGRLRATKENALFFIADEDLDIYPEGVGLEQISLKTHQETREEVDAVIADLKAVVEEIPAEVVMVEEAAVADEEVAVVEENIVAPTPGPSPAPVENNETTKELREKILRIFLIVLASIAIFLLFYAVVMRIFPHFMDHVLYSPEELKILNRN